MDQFDREKAQRVWRRVQGERAELPTNPLLQPNPEGLLLEELTDIRLLQQLTKQQREPVAGALRTLIAQAQSRAAVLRGICHLSSLTPPAALPKLDGPGLSTGLRRLMGQLLRRRLEYLRLKEQPEYGCLYEALSREILESILTLARLIGR